MLEISAGETSIQIPIFNRGKLRMRIKKFRFHFKTENFIQGDKLQEYDELDEEMNNLSDDDNEPHLTQQYYKQYLSFGQLLDEQNINNFNEPTSQYKDLTDSILDELHNKYDLSPRDKTTTSNPPKNVFTWNKGNEALVSKTFIEALAIQTK